MSEDRQKVKTEIIVAVIGLVGVIGAALFSSWDKIFPSNGDDLSSVNIVSSSTSSNNASELAAPIPTTPECSKTIKTPPDNNFLILGWEPVQDASTYSVEIDCFGCNEYGKTWHSNTAEVPWHLKTGLGFRTPIYSSKIHVKKKESGGLALRWRVWAVGHDGAKGKKSDWCKLTFYGS